MKTGGTFLSSLADYVVEQAKRTQSDIVLAHSVASIIALFSALCPDTARDRIIQLKD